MKINEAGITLIKEFEGLRLKAYQDIAGVWTIGYGHTRGVYETQEITKEDADNMLLSDLQNVDEGMRFILGKYNLNGNEWSALASLVFNVGSQAIKPGTTIYKGLEREDKRMAADGFLLWNKARVDGKLVVIDGLERRRGAERALFLRAMIP